MAVEFVLFFTAFLSLFIFAEKVAIKILDKTKLDQKTQRLLSREISSMERLHHPNIIRLYEVSFSCHLTRSHAISPDLMLSHEILCYLTRSHASSRDLMLAHEIS